MVAIAYTDMAPIADVTPIAEVTPIVPGIDITPPAPRRARAAKQSQPRPSGDPLIDATTQLLSVPLRQVYALLWRAGFLVADR